MARRSFPTLDGTMRTFALDDLLKGEDPEATFHDALVEGYCFDARARSVEFRVQVSLYATTREPRYRLGVLRFSEVLSFHVEPPSASLSAPPSNGLWLTADGPVQSLSRERGAPPEPPGALPDGAFHHYLYFSDMNSFMFVVASGIEFAWGEGDGNRRGGAV